MSKITEFTVGLYDNNERNEVNKIFLVNAFNEWGEDMSIEPSEETFNYKLELINKELIKKIL